MSPSVLPNFHSASTRFAGCDPGGAEMPSPLPVRPWQLRQIFEYTARPAFRDASDAATGLFCGMPVLGAVAPVVAAAAPFFCCIIPAAESGCRPPETN